MQSAAAPSLGYFVLPTHLSIENFNEVCRICLNKGQLFPIRKTLVSDLKVSSLLEYSLTIDIKNKNLPQNICEKCLGDLHRVYEFKKRSQDSESILKIFLEVSALEELESSYKETITIVTEREELDEDNAIAEDSKSITSVKEDTKKRENTSDEPQNKKICKKRKIGFKCHECDYTAKTETDLKEHCEETKHSDRRRVICDICGKKTGPGKFLQHMRSHTKEKPFECEICLEKFSAKNALKRHKILHTGVTPHTCTICERGFTRAEYLRRHTKSHEQASNESDRNLTSGPMTIMCSYCGRIFKHTRFYDAHVKTHMDQTDEPDESGVSRDHVCYECGRDFTSRLSLKSHQLTHERSFLCNVCGKVFARIAALKLHSVVHSTERPHACIFCKKTFSKDSSLKIHMLIHSKEKPYVCTVCPRAFKQGQHLKHHMRIHTGEKPYSCQYCMKGFAQKTNMVVHERIHTGERPYVCSLCGKGFCDSSSMKKHIGRHKGEKKAESKEEAESEEKAAPGEELQESGLICEENKILKHV